jgi:2-amino-4-hydroxy-6-hydroxymethyldihydropteridine diphosphokinase
MIILGLGSNMGDRAMHLRQASDELKNILSDIQFSAVYESKALLPAGAEAEWDKAFYNMIVSGRTTLTPQELLKAVKSIEQKIGRILRGHWGPREIDIDILAYNDQITHEPELTIPHKELLHRDFVLVPLAELAPDWVHPIAQKTAQELAESINSTLIKTNIIL